jgi:hypothetical protein
MLVINFFSPFFDFGSAADSLYQAPRLQLRVALLGWNELQLRCTLRWNHVSPFRRSAKYSTQQGVLKAGTFIIE